MDLSIIAPLYNEEESVTLLYEKIKAAADSVKKKYEIIFVDDGSKDNTFSIAEALAKNDSNLKIIKFRGNYGQTPAMSAGIDNASGKIIITMDGDLQNDPGDIPLFLEKFKEGYDLVVGWRHNRQDKLITRKIPSKIANWIIGKVTGVPIRDNGCSLKAYRSELIKKVPLYSEMHRFIPAMASLAGARVAQIKVRHHARQFGESKYGLSRIYKVLMDLLTIKMIVSFSAKPMFWFTILSIPFIFLSFLFISLVGYDVIFFGKSSFVYVGSAILFSTLVAFLLMCGVISELVYKTGDVQLYKLSHLTSVIIKGGKRNEYE